ncbi:Aldehyde dehydrogenase [Peptoniphilus sp. ING2-D1G]|nr:Aldehyde dehydrogenase [Peptoniphilus sp. ING2-D1G]
MSITDSFNKEKMLEFFNSGATMPYEFRIKSLKKLKNALFKYQDEIAKAIKKDFNKSYFETYMTEIMTVKDSLDYMLKNLKYLMKPKKTPTSLLHFKSSSKVFYEPYGIVLVISPWNYPVNLSLSPLIGAIAAGNCVVVKPSSKTKNTSVVLEKTIKEIYEPDYVCVIQGSSEATHALINQNLDYIMFTGSVRAAKEVAKSASQYLTPMTLELGGKSPAVIYGDCNLKNAAQRLTWGKFVNAGQTCIAPDYLLVEKNVVNPLIKAIKTAIMSFYGEEPLCSDDLASIIDENNYRRLKSYLSQGEILFGGRFEDSKRKIEPTILFNPNLDSNVMKEEIFGPILPVIAFENSMQTVEIIRSRAKPLAFYLFTEDKIRMDSYIKSMHFGNGCINDTLIQFANENLPFGGVGNSGMGKYHGRYSFETFSNIKGISKKTDKFDIDFRYPPYTDKKFNMLKYFINRF